MSDDLISREYALAKLSELFVPEKYERVDFGRIGYNHAIADAEATIRFLPSAEPQRKRGKWIERDEDCTWECSACGEPWTLIEGTPKQNGMNYCPNCGAKMEGDE